MKGKDKLNLIYGIFSAMPLYKNGKARVEFMTEQEINKLSKRVNYALRKYAWGIRTTARSDIDSTGLVYSDTDSIKTSNRPQTIIKENK